MLVQELHTDWKQDTTFNYKLGLIEYQCKVKYLPFGSADREEYESKDLTNIYTPVFHLEFIDMNIDKSIYQSHWIVPYSLAWFLENYPESTIENLVGYAAKENGYLQRIIEADRILQRGTQLSIF